MEMKMIVVGYDNTKPSKNALKYAVDLAADCDYSVVAVNILEEPNRKMEKEELLKLAVNSIENEKNVTIETRVIEGSLKKDLSKIAEALEADLVILGMNRNDLTENLFGSTTMHIVKHSHVPFLMINEFASYSPIHKIGVTITSEKESTPVVLPAAKLAKVTGAEVVLIGAHHKAEDTAREVEINMEVARKYLDEVGVENTGVFVQEEDYLFHLMEYCEDYGVNVIASTFERDNFNVFSRRFVQKLMEHSQGIPVLTMEGESYDVGSNLSFMQFRQD